MSIRRRVLAVFRTFHESLTALGEHAATSSEHLVQIRQRGSDQAEAVQRLEAMVRELQQTQVTQAEFKALFDLVKEQVEQGRSMQKHILEDSNELGERVLRLERRVGGVR